ncbi:DUF1090 domain-containing protein [Erwinia sp. P7711]|uniref:DUF1090 domain-containing protein n=1 Tax=Erwinia sp. P7711 TaxID=3141451 RepID=UPI003186AB75
MYRTVAALLFSSCSMMAFAGTQSCAEQLAAISSKLAAARSAGNSYQISGLELARDKVKTYCNDGDQRIRASEEIADKQRKIDEIQEDILEAQRDYNHAVNNGNEQKMAKYQRKLAEKRFKLEEAKSELQIAKDNLAELSK